MLFNSYIFIFLFLPITLMGYVFLGKREHNATNRALVIYWLTLASWIFYSYWNPIYLPLLLGSIIINYSLGKAITRHQGTKKGKWILGSGIALNLASIAYFEYMGFFLSFISLTQADPAFALVSTVLPLGISFFTFQQIAYLVDTYKKQTVEHSFSEYALFVSFFPQLIAGPIVQQKDVLPQFKQSRFKINHRWLYFGLCYFVLGLFKKVAIADTFGQFASPLFATASSQGSIGFIDAWAAALAYTFQLYFDFSAYSDMAIGLGLMFGIRLPLNFYSPYKSLNISDFWRRWHITLSEFLRDYLYIPLGGNRKGSVRRYTNLMIVMLLGGLWHGAGWTFVLWGALHGLYLVINHGWWTLKKAYNLPHIAAPIAWGITFTSVVFAWVMFRANSLDQALIIWSGMVDFTSISAAFSQQTVFAYLAIIFGLFVTLALPNTHQWIIGWNQQQKRITRRHRHGMNALHHRMPQHTLTAIGMGCIAWGSLLLIQFFKSEFLYFNF